MPLTVKTLKEKLASLPDDAEIHTWDTEYQEWNDTPQLSAFFEMGESQRAHVRLWP
jgi:hypothetical protein